MMVPNNDVTFLWLSEQIARKQHDLKKKLKVVFAGEPGLDMGGLTKEWFLLLIRKIFHQDYGRYTDREGIESAEVCDCALGGVRPKTLFPKTLHLVQKCDPGSIWHPLSPGMMKASGLRHIGSNRENKKKTVKHVIS